MALYRWLCRRKRSLLLVFIVSCAWFLYISYLDEQDLEEHKKVKTKNDINKKSSSATTVISHLYFAEKKIKDTKDYVIDVPNLSEHYQAVHTTPAIKDDPKTTQKVEEKDEGQLDQMFRKIKNKTIEIGKKLKSKTIGAGAHVKNKTIEHLKVLGMIKPENKTKYAYYPGKFNLSITLEDISNIMKDTEFMKKLHPLDLNGPILSSTKNRTANFTFNMDYHIGFCDCWERHCVCCARVANKRLHLNSTICSNFTFISKTHELDLKVLLDDQIIHKDIISADEPPLMCLGSVSKVVDICIHFFNVTFKVNAHEDHKTQLLGCTDFSLNLFNKTIGAHPVDCFQIPGDPNQKHKEHSFNLFGNWMP